MTAQISDTFFYNNENWELIASTDEIKFDPRKYGLEPISPCTACWDGFVCDYEITKESLNLKTLYICLGWPGYPGIIDESKEGPEYPVVMNTEATEVPEDSFSFFDHCYNFNMPVKYTGKLMLGKDFMQEYYIHMGWQQAWAFKTVKEFEFKDGVLVNVVDYSDKVEKVRQDLNEHPEKVEEFKGNIPFFVESSFAMDYESKAWWIDKY